MSHIAATKAGLHRFCSISVMGTSPLGSGIIRYSGEGALYDDMLIMLLDYKGVMDVSGTSMTIVASKIECIAKAN